MKEMSLVITQVWGLLDTRLIFFLLDDQMNFVDEFYFSFDFKESSR
jgi:hypothetical protein